MIVTRDTDQLSDGFHTFGELYAFRSALTALLWNRWARAALYDVHKSRRHHDERYPFDNPNWFIVVATTPAGQISFHYPVQDWDRFHIPERERAIIWDGHDAAQALERLTVLIDLETAEAQP